MTCLMYENYFVWFRSSYSELILIFQQVAVIENVKGNNKRPLGLAAQFPNTKTRFPSASKAPSPEYPLNFVIFFTSLCLYLPLAGVKLDPFNALFRLSGRVIDYNITRQLAGMPPLPPHSFTFLFKFFGSFLP